MDLPNAPKILRRVNSRTPCFGRGGESAYLVPSIPSSGLALFTVSGPVVRVCGGGGGCPSGKGGIPVGWPELLKAAMLRGAAALGAAGPPEKLGMEGVGAGKLQKIPARHFGALGDLPDARRQKKNCN